jgi:site-specific DNA recombinase
MRIAVYVRVSTSHQTQTQTIEQQLERLRTHIESQSWQLADEHIFRDDGFSGSMLNRPGLDGLRDRAASGELDLVLMTAPDRLARKYVHQVLLIEELQQHNCEVEFLDRPMSQDPHDQLLLQIRGAVAEYERTLIAERMRRGRLSKYRAGILLPWTRPPYGYRLHPEHPRDPSGVRVEPTEGAIVTEIFAEYLQDGAGLIQVAKQLYVRGIPSPTGKKRWGLASIRGVLTNPAYTGQVFAGRMNYRPAKIRRSATHLIGHPHQSAMLKPQAEWIPVATIPALVTQEQFNLAQVKLAQNKSFAQRNNKTHQYLLRALVSCGVCQLSCFARTMSKVDYGYYVCSGKARAVQCRREDKCPSRFIPAQQLDELVWQDLCEILMHPESIAHALERAQGGWWLPQELQARRENLRRACVQIEHQLNRLTEAYLAGIIPLAEYERRRSEFEQRVAGLNAQANTLAVQTNRQKELAGLTESITDFCARVQEGLANATFEQKRQLVELLIDRVVVTNHEVEIRYVIPTSPNGEHTRFCHLRKDYFHDPTSGTFSSFVHNLFGFLATTTDVRCKAKFFQKVSHFNIVIAFIQTHILLLLSSRFRSFDHNAFKGVSYHLHILAIGAFHCQPDGNAVPLGQHTPFYATFCSIGWVGAAFFSHPMALSPVHHPCSAIPNQCLATHQTGLRLPAIASQTHRLPPTPKNGHGQ